MNIWLIQTGEPLPLDNSAKKMRTAILADELIKRGHSVLWWTSAFDHFKKEWIVKKDTEITINKSYKLFVMKGIGYRKNISISRFIDHRIIAWKFKKLASDLRKPDIIVTSMPTHDLAYQAVMFAEKYDIPVLVDIRDPWPDVFLEPFPEKFQGLIEKLLYRDFQMVKYTMQRADALIAATDMFLQWGLMCAKRQKSLNDRLYPLGYLKNNFSRDIEINENIQALSKKLQGKFSMFFVGTISASYHNPSILLEVAEELIMNKNIHFVIAGDGELQRQLNKAGSRLPNVTFTGWLNRNEIDFLLHKVAVGVCPATKPISFPTNKTFTYMSAGLPIISAFQGDLKDMIEKHKIGFYYPPNDVDALVNCILTLYNDRELYKQMSENARRIFDEMFDADKIYEEYAEHIEKVVSEYKRK